MKKNRQHSWKLILIILGVILGIILLIISIFATTNNRIDSVVSMNCNEHYEKCKGSDSNDSNR